MSFLGNFLKAGNKNIAKVQKEIVENTTTKTEVKVTNTQNGEDKTIPVDDAAKAQASAEKLVSEADTNDIGGALIDMMQDNTYLDVKVNISPKIAKKSLTSLGTKAPISKPRKKLREEKQAAEIAVFDVQIKNILDADKLSKILGNIGGILETENDRKGFDSLIPPIQIKSKTGLLNSSTAEQLLQNQGDFKKTLAKYSALLDAMQNTPSTIKTLKEYKISTQEGYVVLNAYLDAKTYFILGNLTLVTPGKADQKLTQTCFCPSDDIIKLIDTKTKATYNIFTFDSLAKFDKIENDKYPAHYILSDEIREKFIYALLKQKNMLDEVNTLFRKISDENLTPSKIQKEILEAQERLDAILESYVKDLFGNKQADINKGLQDLLGLYSLANGIAVYQTHKKAISDNSVTENTAFSIDTLLATMNKDIVECLDVVASIPQVNLIPTQDPKTLQLLPLRKRGESPTLNVQEGNYMNRDFEVLIDVENWRRYALTDIDKFLEELEGFKNVYTTYFKKALNGTLPQTILNTLEIPKIFADYIGFVFDQRVCALKADPEEGLWGFLSNEISELAAYKFGYQAIESDTNLLEKTYMNRAGVLFQNTIINVINTTINKVSEKTANKLIRIQNAYIQAFNNEMSTTATKAKKPITDSLFARSISYGCSNIPKEDLGVFKNISIVTPSDDNTSGVVLKLENDVLSFQIKHSNKTNVLLRTSMLSPRITYSENQSVSFTIHPKFVNLLSLIASSQADVFANIISLWKYAFFKEEKDQKVIDTKQMLRTEQFDTQLPIAFTEDADKLFNPETQKNLANCLLLTTDKGMIIIPLQDKNLSGETANTQKIMPIATYTEDKAETLRLKLDLEISKEMHLSRTGESRTGDQGRLLSPIKDYSISVTNSLSPILPYLLTLKKTPKLFKSDEAPQRLPDERCVLLSEEQVAQLTSGELKLRNIFEYELFAAPFISNDLGYILFRDVWSSGYTVKQLEDIGAISKENDDIPLTLQHFADRSTTRFGVDFNKKPTNTDHKLLYTMDLNAQIIDSSGGLNYAEKIAKLEYMYSAAIPPYSEKITPESLKKANDSFPADYSKSGIQNPRYFALLQQKQMPIYYDNKKPGNLGKKVDVLNSNYFTRELLTEEFKKFFPEFFSSFEDYEDPNNYPTNGTRIADISQELLGFMLTKANAENLEGDFVDEARNVNASSDELTPILIPNYAKKNFFAGEMFAALLPFDYENKEKQIPAEAEQIKDGIYDNISPIRYKIFLRKDETAGWIDARFADGNGINLFSRFNTFHAVELMTAVPMKENEVSLYATKVPLWRVLVAHYEGQGIEVAFVRSTEKEALVEYKGSKKLFLPTSGSFPPNFFMLKSDKFVFHGASQESAKTKWFKKPSVVSTKDIFRLVFEPEELYFEDTFLQNSGFYYYLASFNPVAGTKNIGELDAPFGEFTDTKKARIEAIMLSLLTISRYRGDYEQLEYAVKLKEEADRKLLVQGVNQGAGEKETLSASQIMEYANIGYAKLVNWWVDLDSNTRSYFIKNYLQEGAASYTYKYQLPQHHNSKFDVADYPASMRDKLINAVPKIDYYTYQKQAINAALAQSRIIFSMEMGLGKTISAITTFMKLKEMGKVDRMLLLLPKAPIGSWKEHFEKYVENGKDMILMPDEANTDQYLAAFERGDKPVLMINPYQARSSENIFEGGTAFFKLFKTLSRVGSRTLFVIDEMHNFKGLKSQQGIGARMLSKKCARVIGMTGTLKPNSILDFYAGLELVVPGIFKGDEDFFMDRYAVKSKNPKLREGTFNPIMLNRLYRTVSPYLFTRVVTTESVITHPEVVSVSLKPIAANSLQIKDALDSVQKALYIGMLLLKDCKTHLKAKEVSAIIETRNEIDRLKIELRDLIRELKKIAESKTTSPAEKTRQSDIKENEIALKEVEVSSKESLAHSLEIGEFSQVINSLKAGVGVTWDKLLSPAGTILLNRFKNAINTITTSITDITNDKDYEREFLRLLAFIRPYVRGVFENAYEKLILTPTSLVKEVTEELLREEAERKEEEKRKVEAKNKRASENDDITRFSEGNSETSTDDKKQTVEEFVQGMREFWDKLLPPGGYTSPKMRYIADAVVKELESGKFNCLVFGFYVETLPAFKKVLISLGVEEDVIGIINGSTSQQNREILMNRFNEYYPDDMDKKHKKPLRVLIAQITTLNAGANLQKKCKFVAFLTTPWSPSILAQAQGRVWRIPQKEVVTVLRPTCTKEDEKKEASLVRKMNSDSQGSGVAGAGNNSIASGISIEAKTGDLDTLLRTGGITQIQGADYMDILVDATSCDMDKGTSKAFVYYETDSMDAITTATKKDAVQFYGFGGLSNKDPQNKYRFLDKELLQKLKDETKFKGFYKQLELEIKAIEDAEGAEDNDIIDVNLLDAEMHNIAQQNQAKVLNFYAQIQQGITKGKEKTFVLSNINDEEFLTGVAFKENAKKLASYLDMATKALNYSNEFFTLVNKQEKQKEEYRQKAKEIKLKVAVREVLNTNPYFFDADAFKPKDSILAYLTKSTTWIGTLDRDRFTDAEISTIQANIENAFKKYFVKPEFNFIDEGVKGLMIDPASIIANALRIGAKFANALQRREIREFLVEKNGLGVEKVVLGIREDSKRLAFCSDFAYGMKGLFIYVNEIQNVYMKMLFELGLRDLAQNDQLLAEIFNKSKALHRIVENESPNGFSKNDRTSKRNYRSEIGFHIDMKIPFLEESAENSLIYQDFKASVSDGGYKTDASKDRGAITNSESIYDPYMLNIVEGYIGLQQTDVKSLITLEEFKTRIRKTIDDFNFDVALGEKHLQHDSASKEALLNASYEKDMDKEIKIPEVTFLKTSGLYKYQIEKIKDIPSKPETMSIPSFPMLKQDDDYYSPFQAKQIPCRDSVNPETEPNKIPRILNPLFFEQTQTKEGILALFEKPADHKASAKVSKALYEALDINREAIYGDYPTFESLDSVWGKDGAISSRKVYEQDITYTPNAEYSIGLLLRMLIKCDSEIATIKIKLSLLNKELIPKATSVNAYQFSVSRTNILKLGYGSLESKAPTAMLALVDESGGDSDDDGGLIKEEDVFRKLQEEINKWYLEVKDLPSMFTSFTKGLVYAARFSAFSVLRGVFITMLGERLGNLDAIYPVDTHALALEKIMADICPFVAIKEDSPLIQPLPQEDLCVEDAAKTKYLALVKCIEDWKNNAEVLYNIETFLKEEAKGRDLKQRIFLTALEGEIDAKLAMLQNNVVLVERFIKTQAVFSEFLSSTK